MQFENASSYLLSKLEKDLPANLTYHNAEHTRNVIASTRFIAEKEGVSDHEMQLLLTAALFHDAGFLEGYKNHEELSCKLARKTLPHFQYSQEDIDIICSLIMVTKLPQTPTNKLEEIMCDADLFYLGSDAYIETSDNLFREYKSAGLVKNEKEWLQKQIQFLGVHQFFTESAKKHSWKKKEQLERLKQEARATEKKPHQVKMHHTLKDIFLIVLGCATAGFALKSFLVPNHFFDGGVTGISLLIHEIYHYNLAYVIVLANLPLIIVSYYLINKKFALKTLASVILLGLALLYLPYPTVTSDKLLIAVFGGFFLGVGVGLTMRAGCALDAVEILALFTFKKTPFTVTEIIFAINILIFSIAALGFGLETALYSALTYYTATRSVDFVVEGIEAFIGVTIISSKSDVIKRRLVNELRKGITVYKGERGFLPDNFEVSTECDIIFTVATRLEIRRLKNLVMETDPHAFVFGSVIKEASGGILSRKQAH